MSSVISWLKKQFEYLKDSLPEILEALLLIFLMSSGIIVAFLFRYLDFNGIVITLAGIISEIITLVLAYMLFRKYLTSEEESTLDARKKKKGILK